MQSKIRVLTDDTVNKIAAGEVIENPASVVKELVENALDAGASEIFIDIKGGGRQLIRVSDNGCGMHSDDALLCLERHATSKIRKVEDIYSLSTMGFRGEAIPSIASISKFTLMTCPKPGKEDALGQSSEPGTMVIVDGGKIVACQPIAKTSGTTVEVKSLFFNVPVRKKFLKSPTIDANEILKTISLVALGTPDIRFQLVSDGKTLLNAPFCHSQTYSERLQERVEHILGKEFLQNSMYLDRSLDGIWLQGVIGLPTYTRHNRSGQHLFINRRCVTSPLINYAIKEGYGSSFPANRHPVFVLHLSIPGELVDVNVHPQKKEVRLRQEQVLKTLIMESMQAMSSYNIGNKHDSFFSDANPHWVLFENPETSCSSENCSAGNAYDSQYPSSAPNLQKSYDNRPIPAMTTLNEQEKTLSSSFSPSILESSSLREKREDQPTFSFSNTATPPRVIATIPRYILLDGTIESEFTTQLAIENRRSHHDDHGGLLLIDQKAAHARIIFEKLQESQQGQQLAQQVLLIPYTFEVASFEAVLLLSALPHLNLLGMPIRQFGPQTFLIDAIPQIFGNLNVQQLVTDLIHSLRDMQGTQILSEEYHQYIASAASRSAISSECRLSLEEAQAIVDQLARCRHPYQCPKGKPTCVRFLQEELSKQFHRFMTFKTVL